MLGEALRFNGRKFGLRVDGLDLIHQEQALRGGHGHVLVVIELLDETEQSRGEACIGAGQEFQLEQLFVGGHQAALRVPGVSLRTGDELAVDGLDRGFFVSVTDQGSDHRLRGRPRGGTERRERCGVGGEHDGVGESFADDSREFFSGSRARFQLGDAALPELVYAVAQERELVAIGLGDALAGGGFLAAGGLVHEPEDATGGEQDAEQQVQGEQPMGAVEAHGFYFFSGGMTPASTSFARRTSSGVAPFNDAADLGRVKITRSSMVM